MIPPVAINAVLFDADSGQWLQFSDPVAIYSAADHASVRSVLDAAEARAGKNNYAVGFVSYEAAPAFEPALTVNSNASVPLAWFAIYTEARRFDFPDVPRSALESLSWQLSIDNAEYRAALARIKKYIHDGDTYQVNYTFRLRTPFAEDPWDLFVHMIHAQGYGYGAYIDSDDFCICSASHELFFSRTDKLLTSKPMKGTVPRALYAAADRDQAEWLRNSAKNQAENLMIVDMVRNDMGQIAETGSVRTCSLFDIERYPTLWQMTSTVQSNTGAGIGRIFQALFPPASITGAPKARTMEIITELENEPRNIYTGSIGFIRPDRSAQFNVAIRTVLVDKQHNTAEYGVGGGIVWDSDTQNELEECYTKARVLTYVQEEFDLLETILWTPEEGYFLLPLHLQRLQESADYFSRRLDPNLIRARLEETAAGLPRQRQRIRLTVARNGEARVEATAITGNGGSYRLHLAGRPVDAENDLFLYHKTTRRRTYEAMREEFPDYDDVLLFNSRQEVTESCIANVVVEMNGELITPPVQCGLLPGIYRRYLLEQNRIREAIITLDELRNCSRIGLINSVRGRWDATLSF